MPFTRFLLSVCGIIALLWNFMAYIPSRQIQTTEAQQSHISFKESQILGF